MKKLPLLYAIFGLLIISCSDDDGENIVVIPDEPAPVEYTSGSANFSNFVAVGNSLTAGFSDSALFIDGQTASFPNMMASNFALVGGGAFNTPFMADNLGGASLGGTPILGNRLILSFASGSPTPTPVPGTGSTEITNTLSGTFNNMGVPGAKSYHLTAPGYGNAAGVAAGLANPYFARFASSPTASVIGDAVAQNPSFFSLWIGNNDILNYATAGGDGVDQTGNLNPATYGSSDITDPNVFDGVYNGLLQALTAQGADGIIANIPDVTKTPFFTTVPHNPLDPTNPDFGPQIPTLNANFGLLNQVFTALGVPERAITFSTASASALVISDDSLVDLSTQITNVLLSFNVDAATAAVTGFLYGQARQATEEDLIVFTSQTEIAELNQEAFQTLQNLGLPAESAGLLAVNGITYPLEDKWVLTPAEQLAVTTAQTAYNQTIAALAGQYNLALADVATFYDEFVESGFPLPDGSTATATYGTGGGFSLRWNTPVTKGLRLACQFLYRNDQCEIRL